MRGLFLSGLLCLTYLTAVAQSGPVYAVWEDPVTLDYYFVNLDPATGVKTNIQVIPGMSAFVAGNRTAYNPDSNYYYVVGLVGTVPHLFTIDAATGNTIYQLAGIGNVVGLEYNCNDSLLYGLLDSGASFQLVKMDPITGIVTPIGGSINNLYVADSFTLDKVQNRYNFVTWSIPIYWLLSYDVTTGMNVATNPFPGSATGYRYSCIDTSVFALREDNNQYLLLNVDVNNGIATTVASLGGVTPGFIAESATVNSNGEYIYRGFDVNNNPALITIDLNTGNVINIVQTNDNATGFEAGVCCYDSSTTVSIPDIQIKYDVSVYPNPVSDVLHISCVFNMKTIELYSWEGKLLAEYNVNSEKYFTIKTPSLNQGAFLNITLQSGNSVLKKIVNIK